MRAFFSCLLAALLALAPAVSSAACPARPLRAAHLEFGHYFHGGTGLEADLLAELRRRSGCRIVGEVYPRARTWVELQNGRIDMALSVIPSPERSAIGWFLPYEQGRNMVLVREDSLPDGVDDMAGFLAAPTLRWATVRGFRHGHAYDDFIAELARQGRLDTVNDSLIEFDMLRRGRVAGVLASPMVYRFQLGGDAMASLRVLDWAPGSEPIVAGLLLSRANFNAGDARYWQGLLDGIRRDGTMLRLFLRYLPPDEARAHQLP
ncbi:ABC transporter substrate-binding protein [Pelomonas sp. KK5]|uniref:substrate-binding periplasmic protein n=1 Tax=Pelomonas sp. KK5 TaxID=1855730 RepID=UPI00097C4634|nr:transporter substrate-binding domain-containing protein [Pelomonas sp. KK5]